MTKGDKINKFIENEKDISRCKISILESISNLKPSKRRLLSIEKSFVNFDFNSMGFSTVDECKEAIDLFRSSRKLFYIKYSISEDKKAYYDIPQSNFGAIKKDFESVSFKFNFIKKMSSHLMFVKPQEVNLVQSDYYFKKLSDILAGDGGDEPNNRVVFKSLSCLLPYEPITMSRQRAREQATYFSIGYFLHVGIQDLESDFLKLKKGYKLIFEDSFNYKSFLKNYVYIDLKLDNLFSSIKKSMYKYYNLSTNKLDYLDDTMGVNNSIGTMNHLEDVFGCDYYSFEETGPIRVFGSNDVVDRLRVSNLPKGKVGIVLPIKRTGNEKMNVFYKKIIHGTSCITELFRDSLSNIKAYDKDGAIHYYKCLLVNKDLNYESLINANFQHISVEDSSLLVARTRSENNCMIESFKNIEAYLDDLSFNYVNLNNTINDRSDRIESRKDIVRKYFG